MFLEKRAIVMLTFIVLAVMMCVPAAFGQSTTNDVSFTGQPAANTCNGDSISLSGTFHSETIFSSNPNGTIHMSFNSTESATGIGTPSGAKYVVSDSAHQEVNSKTMAQEQYFSTKMKLISQGSAPNMSLRVTTHLVVDANGNVTVSTSGFQASCN